MLGRDFKQDQGCCRHGDAPPMCPDKEGLAGWLWEGGQQTARTCQLLQGQPELQRHLAKLTPFPGQPASSDCEKRGVHFRLTRDILGYSTCLQSSLLVWTRLCQPKQLIFPPFLKPAFPSTRCVCFWMTQHATR